MEKVKMFVNGQVMSGGSLNLALTAARFMGNVATAARYRFYACMMRFPGSARLRG